MNSDQTEKVSAIAQTSIQQIVNLTNDAVCAIQMLSNVQIAAVMGSDSSVKNAADLGIAQAGATAKSTPTA